MLSEAVILKKHLPTHPGINTAIISEKKIIPKKNQLYQAAQQGNMHKVAALLKEGISPEPLFSLGFFSL